MVLRFVVCVGRLLFLVWLPFFWSIQFQEHLVNYGFVGIRKTATVVTMSAAIGQQKNICSTRGYSFSIYIYIYIQAPQKY